MAGASLRGLGEPGHISSSVLAPSRNPFAASSKNALFVGTPFVEFLFLVVRPGAPE